MALVQNSNWHLWRVADVRLIRSDSSLTGEWRDQYLYPCLHVQGLVTCKTSSMFLHYFRFTKGLRLRRIWLWNKLQGVWPYSFKGLIKVVWYEIAVSWANNSSLLSSKLRNPLNPSDLRIKLWSFVQLSVPAHVWWWIGWNGAMWVLYCGPLHLLAALIKLNRQLLHLSDQVISLTGYLNSIWNSVWRVTAEETADPPKWHFYRFVEVTGKWEAPSVTGSQPWQMPSNQRAHPHWRMIRLHTKGLNSVSLYIDLCRRIYLGTGKMEWYGNIERYWRLV